MLRVVPYLTLGGGAWLTHYSGLAFVVGIVMLVYTAWVVLALQVAVLAMAKVLTEMLKKTGDKHGGG